MFMRFICFYVFLGFSLVMNPCVGNADLGEESLTVSLSDEQISRLIQLGNFYLNENRWEDFEEIVPILTDSIEQHIAFSNYLIVYSIQTECSELFSFSFRHFDIVAMIEYFSEREGAMSAFQRFYGATLVGLGIFGIDEAEEERLLAKAINLAEEERNFEAARLIYYQLLAGNAENGRAAMGLGHIYRFRGDFEIAEKFYRRGWKSGYERSYRYHLMLLLDMEEFDLIEDVLIEKEDFFNDDLYVQTLVFLAALKIENQDLFLWAYHNAAIEELLKHDDIYGVYDAIRVGLMRFSGEDELRKFESIVEKETTGDFR